MFGLSLIFAAQMGLAQIGINNPDPKASLDIQATNPSTPTGQDGILIPRLADYPSTPAEKGQLIFLDGHPTQPDGFYYWDGTDWQSFIISSFSPVEDKAIYVFTGTGYTGSGGTTERTVIFNNRAAYDLTGFTLSSNQIRVGKKGKYLVSFNSALKKSVTPPAYRALYTYRIKVNGTTKMQTATSIPNEGVTATCVSTSDILELQEGDLITATVQKNDEGHSNNEYTGYGTNAITLTYLID